MGVLERLRKMCFIKKIFVLVLLLVLFSVVLLELMFHYKHGEAHSAGLHQELVTYTAHPTCNCSRWGNMM